MGACVRACVRARVCVYVCVVCGVCVRCAVCGVRCAVCGVRCAVCGVRCAVCGVRCAVCGVRCAVCGVRCVCVWKFIFKDLVMQLLTSISRPWYVETATPIPKDIVVVLDRSGTMSHGQSMKTAKDAAKTVVGTLNPKDRVRQGRKVLYVVRHRRMPNNVFDSVIHM